MKTLENHYGGNLWDRFNNAIAIDKERVRTVFARASDAEGVYTPGEKSLFYNGLWMIRITAPFGIWLHLRPSASGKKNQAGIGWKLNGRFAVLLRRQSDASAAQGTHGPNLGQATRWARGTA